MSVFRALICFFLDWTLSLKIPLGSKDELQALRSEVHMEVAKLSALEAAKQYAPSCLILKV